MKNLTLKSITTAMTFAVLTLTSMAFAQNPTGQLNDSTSFISKGVKLTIKTASGEPIANIPLIGIETYSAISLGLFTAGHILPQFNPHTREMKSVETNLGVTDENGQLIVSPYYWSKNKLGDKNLTVRYLTRNTDQASVGYGCEISAENLNASADNNSFIELNCVGYLAK